MCDFTKKNFFVRFEISRRFLPDERLFVEKGHLLFSFFISASVRLMPLLGNGCPRVSKKRRETESEIDLISSTYTIITTLSHPHTRCPKPETTKTAEKPLKAIHFERKCSLC